MARQYSHPAQLVKSLLAFAFWAFYHSSMNIFPATKRKLIAILGLFSAFMLGSALIGQYGFNLHPCELCIKQRYPYAAIIAISLAGYFFIKSPRTLSALVAICGVLFFADAAIAFYHTGVEYGWFPGPDSCSSGDESNMTLEEMRAAIMNAPLVTCAQAMAYIFGFSMAAWNFLFATLAGIATFVALRKTK